MRSFDYSTLPSDFANDVPGYNRKSNGGLFQRQKKRGRGNPLAYAVDRGR